ncbi:MAG: DAK2 domain-containing protein [Ruminococcaceae bacterium]|nr:DAK2 domain-containing protein [Oscillospiraceae bacterium]
MFNGNTLRDALLSGANNIVNCKVAVDELNVFPVPDGDTGTNMSMTISAAARELALLDGETAEKVANVNASALLRGARGNSGVILSLLFRGFAKGLKGKAEVDAEGLANAMKIGVDAAYNAVMKPTEGTILTVARVASEYATVAYKSGKDALGVFEAILEGAEKALNETPEMLPVLKKAGVVDAGGKGFLVILEGMYSVFKDGKIIESTEAVSASPAATQRNAAAESEADITFTYCTEFIVKRDDENKDPKTLRAYLETIGDCVVVVDDEEIIKVHVHTDHPGNAFEKGLTFGQLINMKVENMRDQHERAKHDAKSEAPKTAKPQAPGKAEPVAIEKDFGFVAVAAGEGLHALFNDLGCDMIVSGGQTMNPSTDDILNAIEQTPASTVFVLPNNKNIIMAAEQAIPLSTRKVIVLPTRTIPQGISAMLSFDPDSDADTNAINMQKGYENVQTGQVTFAARNSEYDGKEIKMGDLLALANGKVSFTDTDLKKAVLKLIKNLSSKDTAFITLIYGEDVSEEDAEAISEAVQAKLGSDVEVTLINGGQPVYYFIISVE